MSMRFDRFLYASVAPLAAAFATGCSDPVPPTPQGAWNVNFGPAVDAAACKVAQHTASVGGVGESDRDKVIVDGAVVDGAIAAISCSVIGQGKFNVTAQAELK